MEDIDSSRHMNLESNQEVFSTTPLAAAQPGSATIHRVSSNVSPPDPASSASYVQVHPQQPISSSTGSDEGPSSSQGFPESIIRDFAYPIGHQLHPGNRLWLHSEVTTPTSESDRGFSSPYNPLWNSSGPYGFSNSSSSSHYARYPRSHLLANTTYRDGPPYAVDDDLLSPIVTSTARSSSTRHKKSRSNNAGYEYGQESNDGYVQFLTDATTDLNLQDYHHQTSQIHQHGASQYLDHDRPAWRHEPSFDPSNTPELHVGSTSEDYSPSEPQSEDLDDTDNSRLSRAYQFTIASPDEEFHGKAVALFDFQRENDNELPFIEGQVLWVSYRHGEGWLVAQDPKSGESGLVPEEYVRLLRDIEGGLSSLKGEDYAAEDDAELMDGYYPAMETQDPPVGYRHQSHPSSTTAMTRNSTQGENQPYKPVVSHFTTSSKDLELYSLQGLPAHRRTLSASSPHQPSRVGLARHGEQQDGETRTVPAGALASSPTAATDEDGGVLLSPDTFKPDGVESPTLKDKEVERPLLGIPADATTAGGMAMSNSESVALT